MYLVFYVGFYCMGCVWERLWRGKRLIKESVDFAGILREAFLQSEPRAEHMTGMRRVMTAGFREYFTGKTFSRDTCETFSYFGISITPCFHPHYIYLHYPHIGRGAFQRENPSHNPWELEIVIPIILYIIFCGFPQLLPLHIQILERLIAQTLIAPILSVKWGFGAAGKHWKKPFVWWMQSG